MSGIKIVLPNKELKSNEARLGLGTQVFTSNGHEIDEILSIDIHISSDEFVTATVEMCVDSIENLDNILPELGDKTIERIKELTSGKNKA